MMVFSQSRGGIDLVNPPVAIKVGRCAAELPILFIPLFALPATIIEVLLQVARMRANGTRMFAQSALSEPLNCV